MVKPYARIARRDGRAPLRVIRKAVSDDRKTLAITAVPKILATGSPPTTGSEHSEPNARSAVRPENACVRVRSSSRSARAIARSLAFDVAGTGRARAPDAPGGALESIGGMLRSERRRAADGRLANVAASTAACRSAPLPSMRRKGRPVLELFQGDAAPPYG